MTNKEFISNLSSETAKAILHVDGFETNLYDFLEANMLDEDVDHITIDQANEVTNLKPGESIYIGICEVKRLS